MFNFLLVAASTTETCQALRNLVRELDEGDDLCISIPVGHLLNRIKTAAL